MLNSQIKICCENFDLKSLVSIESARVFDHCSIRPTGGENKRRERIRLHDFYHRYDSYLSFLNLFGSTEGIHRKNRSIPTLRDKCPWISLRLFLVVWRAYERERSSARLSKIAHRAPKFWGTRGNQPSKVQWRPKPGNTAFVITVVPVPCKYGNLRALRSLLYPGKCFSVMGFHSEPYNFAESL